jgi:hypothetical protein
MIGFGSFRFRARAGRCPERLQSEGDEVDAAFGGDEDIALSAVGRRVDIGNDDLPLVALRKTSPFGVVFDRKVIADKKRRAVRGAAP